MRRIISIWLPAFCFLQSLSAQHSDSLSIMGMNVIESKVETLEEAAEAGLDLDELTSDLTFFLENPININTADKSTLKKLGFFTDIQIKNLIDYRKKYGAYLSIYEMAAIDGIGKNTLEKIMPFVMFGDEEKVSHGIKKLLWGRHELIIRFQRKMRRPAGYNIPPDSLQPTKSGSMYLGDPNRYYLRYRYRVKNKMSIGFLAEKDPGEMFLSMNKGISASMQEQIKAQPGFDFYSFHLSFERMGVIRRIILGDFHVRFGQGLVVWSGLSFAGGSDPASMKRYAAGIRPNTSANEGTFMRGTGIQMQWKAFDLAFFFSRKRRDANIKFDKDEQPFASSFPTGGYHRTLNELEDKNSIQEQHLGGHISFQTAHIRIGATACKTWLNLPYLPDDQPYRKYQFRGTENFNTGIDFDILLRRTNIYGEIGMSANGGWALLAGITHNTGSGSIIAIEAREYRKQYQNLLAQASGRRDGNANERGVKTIIEVPMFRKLIMLMYWDQYSYPWISSRSINTFRGQEYLLKLDYKPGRNTILSAKYRYRLANIKDNSNLSWIDEMLDEHQHVLRFEVRHSISPTFSIKSQIQFIDRKTDYDDTPSRGSLFLQDIYYHPVQWPLRISFRYALFNTDDYNSRLYAYEHDVLYASSMPALYGKGYRFYLVMKYSPAKWLDTWFRFSLTAYSDRKIVGSGPEEIIGNKVPEVKVQMRVKL